MKHVSGYEQHPSSEAECRPGWMFWVPPPEVGRRPGREPALQKTKDRRIRWNGWMVNKKRKEGKCREEEQCHAHLDH